MKFYKVTFLTKKGGEKLNDAPFLPYRSTLPPSL